MALPQHPCPSCHPDTWLTATDLAVQGCGTKGLRDRQWGVCEDPLKRMLSGIFIHFYEQIFKALHKPRKYLLILCSYSDGELWSSKVPPEEVWFSAALLPHSCCGVQGAEVFAQAKHPFPDTRAETFYK